MKFPGEQYYAFCEVRAGHGVGASACGRASFLGTKCVLAGFDELRSFGTRPSRFDGYDESSVQEQRAGLGALPGKGKRTGSRIVMFVFGRNFFMRAE